jgi:hypothetical protein
MLIENGVSEAVQSGKVEVAASSVLVTLDKRAHNPNLVASGLTTHPPRRLASVARS